MTTELYTSTCYNTQLPCGTENMHTWQVLCDSNAYKGEKANKNVSTNVP